MNRTARNKKKARMTARKQRDKKHAQKPHANWTLIGMVAAMWVVTILIFYVIDMKSMPHTELAVGQRAPVSIISSVDFTCENLAATDLRRSQASKEAAPVFELAPKPWSGADRFLGYLESRLLQLQIAPSNRIETATASITGLLEGMSLELTASDFAGLSDESKLKDGIAVLRQTLKDTLAAPVIEADNRSSQFEGLVPTGTIHILREGDLTSTAIALEKIRTIQEARSSAIQAIRLKVHHSVLSDKVLEALTTRWITPNLVYNRSKTAQLRKEAIDQVVLEMETVTAGTTIMEAHDVITPQMLARLRAHETRLSETESKSQKAMRALGGSTLLLAALLAAAGTFSIVSRRWDKKTSDLFLLILLCLIPLGIDKILLFSASRVDWVDPSHISFMLPHALTPLLATVLLGPVYGVVSGIWVSLAGAILFEQNFSIFMLGFLVTIVSTQLGREVKNRTSLFHAALWIILTKIVFVLIQAVLNRPATHVIFAQVGAATASGLFSAFFAILTIPLFELAFKITTDIKLLELSDMSHPLLQRLAIEAPGTYHHSLMMANLAAQAAERIGANALLTRVAGYFHDIGKMVKPEFFTENIQYRENPHDDLSPSMSTLVIMSHVKEGEELARRYKLPEQIIAGIREHHGTSLVSYFYHRAKTQSEGSDSDVNESDYRYDGPRPITKEMAILTLADSVEAASRSLAKVTPTRIAALVDEIVDKKVKDRQLANSELTLAQLSEIKTAFTFTLTNMLHGRVAYPKDDNNHSK
jgi:putative nucleotidyltransferase with HDIG domain